MVHLPVTHFRIVKLSLRFRLLNGERHMSGDGERALAQAELNANEDDAKIFLASYDEKISKLQTEVTHASWNYNINLTDHNANILVSRLIRIIEQIVKLT